MDRMNNNSTLPIPIQQNSTDDRPMGGGEDYGVTVTKIARSAAAYPSTIKAQMMQMMITTYCYVLPVICLVGIVGNIANLKTLRHPKLKAVSYVYLRALAIADLFCLTNVLIYCALKIASLIFNWQIVYFYSLAWYHAHMTLPSINIFTNLGNLLITALTFERFLSVCFPIYFRRLNSTRRVHLIITGSIVLVSILHVPQAFKGAVYCINCETPNENETTSSSNNSELLLSSSKPTFFLHPKLKYRARDSKMAKTVNFIAYEWVREVLLKFVPIFAILIMNLAMAVAFKRHGDLKRRLSSSSGRAQRENQNLMYLMIGIVILFFICKIPAALNLLLISDERRKNLDYQKFRSAANLLEIANHALNFYVFCLCSQDYRHIFLDKFPLLNGLCEQGKRFGHQLNYSIVQPIRKLSMSITESYSSHQHQQQRRSKSTPTGGTTATGESLILLLDNYAVGDNNNSTSSTSTKTILKTTATTLSPTIRRSHQCYNYRYHQRHSVPIGQTTSSFLCPNKSSPIAVGIVNRQSFPTTTTTTEDQDGNNEGWGIDRINYSSERDPITSSAQASSSSALLLPLTTEDYHQQPTNDGPIIIVSSTEPIMNNNNNNEESHFITLTKPINEEKKQFIHQDNDNQTFVYFCEGLEEDGDNDDGDEIFL